MAISTNPKPTIYRNLYYKNTGPGPMTGQLLKLCSNIEPHFIHTCFVASPASRDFTTILNRRNFPMDTFFDSVLVQCWDSVSRVCCYQIDRISYSTDGSKIACGENEKEVSPAGTFSNPMIYVYIIKTYT